MAQCTLNVIIILKDGIINFCCFLDVLLLKYLLWVLDCFNVMLN